MRWRKTRNRETSSWTVNRQGIRSGITVSLVALAFVPLLLSVYSSQFSRLFADDYCRIEAGAANGPLHNVAVWRSRWTGSYTNYFLHGVFAPLDWQIARVLPAFTSVIWLVGLAWLLWRAFGYWVWRRHRLVAAVACAALLLATIIDAFYTKQIFYYYTAHLSYASPMALFTLFLAALFEAARRFRSGPRLALAAVSGFVFCYLNAGFAEMVLVAQAIALVVLLGAAFLLAEGGRRRPLSLLVVAGLLGTIASAATMLTAPGVQSRAEWTETYVAPVRALPQLLELGISQALEFLLDPAAFAGFALVFALGMAAGQIAPMPNVADAGASNAGMRAAPLMLGLAIQLAFVPFLWTHTSDMREFFGRFSMPFMLVIGLNLAQIIGYAALLLWRRRITAWLGGDRGRSASMAGLALIGAFALFMATQFRSIDFRAGLFLYVSALAILANVSAQSSCCLPQPVAWLWRGGVIACLGAAAMISLALSLVALYGVGVVEARYAGPVAVLQICAGFAWGMLVGAGLARDLRESGDRPATALALRALPLLVVLAIGVDSVAGQLRWLPNLRTFAREWDARHEAIVEQRDGGQLQLEIRPLSYNMASEFWDPSAPRARHNEELCAEAYYGLESISIAQDAQGRQE